MKQPELKRFSTIFILLLLSAPIFAQQLNGGGVDARFTNVIYDFGLIKESAGPVFHDFYVRNIGTTPIQVDTVEVSCGCTSPLWQKSAIAPGDSSFIRLVYDPTGRPGVFTKSATVRFSSKGQQIKRYVNIKGQVVKKSLEDQLPAGMQSGKTVTYTIEVAPYLHQLNFSPVPVKFKNTDFNTFINDLTYVIDQEGFVNVSITAPSYENKRKRDTILTRQIGDAKRAVLNAFKYRGYLDHQVAFSVSLERTFPWDWPKAKTDTRILTLRSSDFGNDDLTASKIEEVGGSATAPVVVDAPPVIDTILHEPNLSAYHRQAYAGGKFEWDAEGYDKFIRKSVREIVANGFTRIQIKVVQTPDAAELAKSKKKAPSLVAGIKKSVLKDFAEEGFEEGQVIFVEDKVRFYDAEMLGDYAAEKYNFVQISRVFIEEEDALSMRDELKSENATTTTDVSPTPVAVTVVDSSINTDLPDRVYKQQTLPVSKTFINERYARIDTTDPTFLTMMTKVTSELRNGEPISFVLESSASTAPTRTKFGNDYVARLRAKESQEIIKQFLLNRGIADNAIKFRDPICLVQGPQYITRYYLPKFYEQFQYVKVIPLYDNGYEVKNSSLMNPYMVNFDYNSSEINTDGMVYAGFIKRLISVVEKQGYIKLIIESSASKVPTRDYRNNIVLAYDRAEDARQKLYNSMVEHGIDPQRIIIVEERTLVQGPDYEKGFDRSLPTYTEHQYIKIIPAIFIAGE